MKFKTLLIGSGLFAFTYSVKAQTISIDAEMADFIPKGWTIDKRAKLVAGDYQFGLSSGEDMNVSVYNDNFENEASFTIKPEKHIRSKLEERVYIPVLTDVVTHTEDIWTMETFLERYYHLNKIYIENNYVIPDSMLYVMENGDSVMIAEYDVDWETGKKYPNGGFILSYAKYIQGVTALVTFSYEQKYAGDWQTQTYEDVIRPKFLSYSDLDGESMVVETEAMLLTQTLFNDDEKYEYLMPDCSACSEEVEEYDRDGDGVIDKRVTYYYPTSLKIMNTDGETIGNLDFTFEEWDEDYMSLIHWGGKLYFKGTSHAYIDGDGVYTQHFYLFDRNTTSVKKIETPAMFSMLPQVAKKNQTVEIEIAEEASKNGGKIVVTDMNGRNVHSQSVAAGERTMQVPVNRLSSGVYGVSLMTNGKRIESSKLIVR